MRGRRRSFALGDTGSGGEIVIAVVGSLIDGIEIEMMKNNGRLVVAAALALAVFCVFGWLFGLFCLFLLPLPSLINVGTPMKVLDRRLLDTDDATQMFLDFGGDLS